ncbi:PREDICTED: uncharacterized protein At3g60930, chloroplastic-like [Camelina sativa]|uniref:Uncharacterized protein At3g60930, chloroplastic-like n=1 Tax=Camelina sativa TaxID=90675 RepID=A0ABM1RPH8_CAMSA|nr:PREDICTED: uncharacterized protein At3g60930, chloroplastic-like [Camelina sativa]
MINDLSPLRDHRGDIGGEKTTSTSKSVGDLLNSCGLANSIVHVIIPGEHQRLWTPPLGYICLYEGFFSQCRLFFPLPNLLTQYAHRRKIPICQLTPGSICNFVAALTLAAEDQVFLEVECFEQLTNFKNSQGSKLWMVNAKPAHNFLPGEKVSNFKKLRARYFFVRVYKRSFENPKRGRRRVWNDSPDRPSSAWRLSSRFKRIKNTLLGVADRSWAQISRRRMEAAMGKARTQFASFASSLGQTSEVPPTTIVAAEMLRSVDRNDEPTINPEPEQTENEFIDVEDEDELPAADEEDENVAPNDSPLPPPTELIVSVQIAAEPDDGSKKKKSKKDKNKEKGKGKASAQGKGQKRSVEEAGLESYDRFRVERAAGRTDQFRYDYFGETPLVCNREASAELCRQLALSSVMMPPVDKLEFKDQFAQAAQSALQTAAYMSVLTLMYDRRVKSMTLAEAEFEKMKECLENLREANKSKNERIKELKDLLAKKEHDCENLEGRVAELESHGKVLEEEKAKLSKQFDDLGVKFESEMRRLRLDRQAKVEGTTKKAQHRLDKVKDYLHDQEMARPKEDVLNQANGFGEIMDYLLKNGASIPDNLVAEIKKKREVAQTEVEALDLVEFEEGDLDMSPDQLGFGLLQSGDVALDSVPHPYGSNVGLFQAGLPENVP